MPKLRVPLPLAPVLLMALALVSLPGCQTLRGSAAGADLAEADPASGQPPAPERIHSFTIERAYSLSDPRELAFRDQIAAEARAACGQGDYSLYASRPFGNEEVREDFLYRLYAVEITCESAGPAAPGG